MNDEKKKQAFDKAVNDTVHCLYEFHRENMNKADDPEAYLQDEINYLDQKLNSNLHVLFMVRTGTRDYSGFTDSLCDEILSTEEPQKWVILWPEIKDGKVISRKDNQFYGIAIDLKLKTKFEALKASLKTIKPSAVERVEEIKREREITYPKAIEIFNTEIGYQHYKDYASFKSARFRAKRGY